jgi:hypothetical protein
VVRGAVATVLGGTVDLAETADTDGLAKVNVTGDGSSTDVEPVDVQRRELLGVTSLDGVNPTLGTVSGWSSMIVEEGKWSELTRDGQLALTLQERSIGVDELLRLIDKYPLA